MDIGAATQLSTSQLGVSNSLWAEQSSVIVLSSRQFLSSSQLQNGSLIGESLSEEEDKEAESKGSTSDRMRLAAYHLLLWGIRCGGAAFIKWGQWSATREDMFPPELCHVLAELHDQAPVHSWAESKREIERVFKRSVEELFESIDHEPLASGSIAQVPIDIPKFCQSPAQPWLPSKAES